MPHIAVARSAGVGLVVYGVGTALPFMFSGAPGGDYSASTVADYVAPGHLASALALWYVGALAALALVVVAGGLRRLPGTGHALSALAVVGAATGVVGAFVSGGVDVAMAEGHGSVRSGVEPAVVYLVTEIGNLLAVCGPALCVGAAALVLAARGPLPGWLRAFSAIAGVCGLLAPFFFTYFVFVIWTIVAGVVVAARRQGDRAVEPSPSLV
jgi:hypothetical protein